MSMPPPPPFKRSRGAVLIGTCLGVVWAITIPICVHGGWMILGLIASVNALSASTLALFFMWRSLRKMMNALACSEVLHLQATHNVLVEEPQEADKSLGLSMRVLNSQIHRWRDAEDASA